MGRAVQRTIGIYLLQQYRLFAVQDALVVLLQSPICIGLLFGQIKLFEYDGKCSLSPTSYLSRYS